MQLFHAKLSLLLSFNQVTDTVCVTLCVCVCVCVYYITEVHTQNQVTCYIS